MKKIKKIPAEYLQLRLDQVLIANRTPAPKTGNVDLDQVLAAVRALAAEIAQRDAKQHREEVAWARRQLASLTTSLPKPKCTRRTKASRTL